MTNIKSALYALALTCLSLFISFLFGAIDISILYTSAQLEFVALISISAFVGFYLLVREVQ